MTTVKTAISLPASLFEQAETLAGEMQISQSFLIEIALEEFIRRRENQQLLEKLMVLAKHLSLKKNKFCFAR